MPSPSKIAALGLVATGSFVAAGPCDIYASGNTPCIAAHSTTRALYNAFSGSLYQVKRGSDGATTNVAPLAAGGVANAATQDKFCANTTCLITIIYDQSGRDNHLTQAPPGGFNGPEANGYDNLAGAIGAPVTLNGKKAYGVFVSPGTGYRNNKVSGSATGDAAEGMYAVLDGTHFNDACCFDYGNAETNNLDTGKQTLTHPLPSQPANRIHRQRPHGGYLLRNQYDLGHWRRLRPLANGGSRKRPLLRHVPEEQPSRPYSHRPLPHHRLEGRPEQVGSPRRQRCIRLAINVLQRRAAQRLRLQPHEQGRRDYPGYRW